MKGLGQFTRQHITHICGWYIGKFSDGEVYKEPTKHPVKEPVVGYLPLRGYQMGKGDNNGISNLNQKANKQLEKIGKLLLCDGKTFHNTTT